VVEVDSVAAKMKKKLTLKLKDLVAAVLAAVK